MTKEAAESLAIQAVAFLAADVERIAPFLAATGIGPEAIRAAARQPDFLAGVLDYLAGDEALLMAFAREADIDPAAIEPARVVLGGGGPRGRL